jgi:hypothetical protein
LLAEAEVVSGLLDAELRGEDSAGALTRDDRSTDVMEEEVCLLLALELGASGGLVVVACGS